METFWQEEFPFAAYPFCGPVKPDVRGRLRLALDRGEPKLPLEMGLFEDAADDWACHLKSARPTRGHAEHPPTLHLAAPPILNPPGAWTGEPCDSHPASRSNLRIIFLFFSDFATVDA
jgi:hypothetical protein